MNRFKKSALYCILSVILLVSQMKSAAWAAEDENTGEAATANQMMAEAAVEYPRMTEISAEAAILIDADTGAVLYEKNSHEKLYPASITKIMTALLAIENLQLNNKFTFTEDIINALPYDAAKYGYVAGEQVLIEDALYVLLLRSANEVAIGLGMSISGDEEAFGRLMTERAKEAGALNTNFVNATGLHDDNHYTTAYDMAMIAKEAMKNTTFVSVWGSENYVVSPTNISAEEVRIWNRHELLVSTTANYYQYANGGKTGYTDEAGRTLVTSASKDGMNLICVVMKSDTEGVYTDTRNLFEYGFDNFKKVRAGSSETRFGQTENSYFVSRSNLFEGTGKLLEVGDDFVTIPQNASLSQVGYKLSYSTGGEEADASKIADIQYFIGEHYLGTTTLSRGVYKDTDDGKLGDSVSSDSTDNVVDSDNKKEELTINIWWLLAGIVAVLVVLVVLLRLKRTRLRRAAKRKRKKLFKDKKRKTR